MNSRKKNYEHSVNGSADAIRLKNVSRHWAETPLPPVKPPSVPEVTCNSIDSKRK
jgi:hypothetical protein